jgi:eukaryotic-like serine/threonine-protein kinase
MDTSMGANERIETDEHSAGSVTGDLIGARPGVDYAAMENVRAQVQHGLFGAAEPPRLGRFILLKPIAGGGMGMIHRAYDPQLERPVALKLLHPRLHDTALARGALLDEARVLARLAHPNVVPVYEVVELDNQIMMVMELVEGRTLAEWERDPQRFWRDIVEVYLQAGRGLAAAHALGIVHRDFKPSNATVGTDGRVRVLDFGLARLTETAPAHSGPMPPTEVPAGDRGASQLGPDAAPGLPPPAAPNEVAGTLAYMAPEQLAGNAATPASDQFSFCVSLYRALYGVPPFAGRDAVALRESIMRQQVEPGSSKRLPVWLRAVLGRGLAAEPDRRYPSMAALLEDLARVRGWRRWRWAVITGTMSLIAAGSIVAGFARTPDPLAGCDGGIEEVSRVWNPSRAQHIRDALSRVDTPYAYTIGDRVLLTLDRYRDRWSTTHRATCRDYRMVRLSPERFQRRKDCLDRRLLDLASAVDVLGEINVGSVSKAVDVAARLPTVESCMQADTLPDGIDPPPTPDVSSSVAEIHAQLSHAFALERAGRSTEAVALADGALDAARRLTYPAAVLEAALAKGRILTLGYNFEAAIPSLALAERLALEHRQFSSAVVAGARRIYAEGVLGSNAAHLDYVSSEIELLEPLSRSLGSDHFARPLLLNYIGVAYMARADRDKARAHFEAARALLENVDPVDLELVAIDMNLAMVTEDRALREMLARREWQQYKDKLGPYHTTTLVEQCRYAHYLASPLAAIPLLHDANELFRRYHPDRVLERSDCLSYEAFLTTEIGVTDARAKVVPLYEEIVANARGATDDDVISRAHLAHGYAELYQDRPARALDEFTAVIRGYASGTDWWDQKLAAEGELGAGLTEAARDEAGPATGRAPRADLLDGATAHLERAVEILGGMLGRNENVETRQLLALARVTLARVLRRTKSAGADVRASALEAQATAFYRETDPAAYRHRLDTLHSAQ